MIIGETLGTVAGNVASALAWSPWFPSLGNAAVFSCQVLAMSASVVFDVAVWTKSDDDTDDDATLMGSMTLTSGGDLKTCTVSGCKDLVRYAYHTVDLGGVGDQWVHFVMLSPSWSENRDLVNGLSDL